MTWKDITIEKYEKIAALQEQDLSEIDLVAAVVAVLDNITVKEVEEMPYATLLLKARNLRFLNTKPIPSIIRKTYEFGGNKYVATVNPADLTTAQYIDFQVRATDAPEDLAGLLSIILIPEGYKYNEGYHGDDVRKAIYEFMPIEDAMGLSAFFFTLWKKSICKLLRASKRMSRQLSRKRTLTEAETQLIATLKSLTETLKQVQKYY